MLNSRKEYKKFTVVTRRMSLKSIGLNPVG